MSKFTFRLNKQNREKYFALFNPNLNTYNIINESKFLYISIFIFILVSKIFYLKIFFLRYLNILILYTLFNKISYEIILFMIHKKYSKKNMLQIGNFYFELFFFRKI